MSMSSGPTPALPNRIGPACIPAVWLMRPRFQWYAESSVLVRPATPWIATTGRWRSRAIAVGVITIVVALSVSTQQSSRWNGFTM